MSKKSTKRALLMSILSLLLCVSMLVGTTFAWFTDSVTSGRNIIQSGNLDVELEYSLDKGATWKPVTKDTKVFDYTLWEPGYTQVAYFKVINKGSLALKYQLTADVYSETTGKTKTGAEIKLSKYLKYGVTEDLSVLADRTKAAAAATNGFDSFELKASSLLAETGKNEAVIGMVITMPETVGNEANHNGTDIPSIEFGINLLATQYTYEEDSFGDQYDVNAPFSVWDGSVPAEMPKTLVVDGATQTVHVKDAAAFAYLSTLSAKWADLYTDGNGRTYTNYANGAGANYYYSGQWKVSLEADIDLNNHAITPVDITFGENTGGSVFDGNRHVIRNINTTTGLFKNDTRASISNLTLENVKATNGALIGSARYSISKVTVKNAVISGTDYVGGLVGRIDGNVTNCKVIDSYITATGKEAGGLIGYIASSSGSNKVTDNAVRNVSVYAGNRAAGLVAQPNVGVKVYDNTVDTVTVGAADTSKYQPGAVVSNALEPANVYDNTVTNANVATKAAAATDNNSLKDAIASGADTVFLGSDDYVVPSAVSGKTVDIVGNGDTVIDITTVPTYAGLPGATITFDNVVIKSDPQGAGYNRGFAHTNTVTYNNCVINGTLGLNTDTEFNNCTFNISGDYYSLWTWGAPNVALNGCVFNSDGKAVLLYGTANTKLTVNDCVFNDKGGLTDLKAAIEIGNDYGKSYELIVNNTVVNGYEINDKGINTGSTLWANKNSMGTDKLNVVIDGVDVY